MKKILLIDNDRVFLLQLERLLKQAGYQVETANDGLDALDILKTITPDAIFTDLVMPNIDGRALCRIIRGMENLKNIPIIFLSAALAEDLPDLFQLPVNGCIVKGAFSETAEHVIEILKQPALASRRCLPGETIGVKNVDPSGITQELLLVKRHFEAIIGRMSEGIAEINSDGRIVFANSAILSMVGGSETNLLGADFTDLFSGDERSRIGELLEEAARKDEEIIKDQPFILNDYHITLDIMSLGEDAHKSLIILRDITAIKRTEDALKVFNAELEQRVHERTAELEAANRTTSEFVANMSHEIRTPMNGIIGACDLALREDPSQKTREYLEMIQGSATTLMALVNDILDFSAIESGHIKFESNQFSLRETMEHIYDVFHERIQEKDLEFAVEIPREIPDRLVGDPLRLRQIVINLLGNAFKFTGSGEIVLRIRPQQHDSSKLMLLFSVTDTGIGIPEDKIGTLFDAFVQVDSSTTKEHEGTGLGLAICKKLVELMGGDIRVDSTPGKGTTFSFTAYFGIASETGDRRSGKSRGRTNLVGLKFLVVDDHPVTRETLGMLIASFGCRIRLVASAKEAVELCAAAILENDPFDLILMDYKMDEMNGLELGTEISRRCGRDAVPAMVMISGYTAAIDQAAARKAGILKVLSKPIKRLRLFDELTELFVEKKQSPLPDQSAVYDAEADFTGKRVLLVEDNPINQRVAEALLKSVNFEVVIVDDGAAALEMLEKESFHAVLMDVQMPIMDGYEATRQIRVRLELKNLPIIAMTAHATKEAMEKCFAAGMDDYISKPIDRAKLLTLLEKLLLSA